jgi:hypothetical protein
MSLIEKIRNKVLLQRYNKRNASPAQKLWARIKYLFAMFAVIALIILYNNYQFQSLLAVLEAPNLPKVQTYTSNGVAIKKQWLDQNWGNPDQGLTTDTKRYHHISQGTATLSMPYDWFTSLEAPESSLWTTLLKSVFLMKSELFSDNDYLLRFGFIESEKDPVNNPDGLPIGFSKTQSLNIAGIPVKTEGVGFNCAACHTGHFISGEGENAIEYIIEGAPATTDLGQLTAAIAASLGQTALSSKIPLFDGRFDRFAKRVLGQQYSAEGKATLATDIANLIEAAEGTVDIVNVQEGYSRLDALNRIGNQVFAKALDRRENYQPVDAPVNYPFIWTSSWFKWVQYDASIMQPLVRNVGEAIGVSAHLEVSAPKDEGRFQSSVPLDNLIWIEDFLKGPAFNEGLKSPPWPFEQVSKHDENYIFGKALYQERCQGCHMPEIDEIDTESQLKTISYVKNGKMTESIDKVLDLVVIKQNEIGTDPAQGNVLVSRMLNTAGNNQAPIEEQSRGVGLDTLLCGQDMQQALSSEWAGGDKTINLNENIQVKDGGDLNFAYALGAIVQQTIDAWFKENNVADVKLIEKLSGGRPNCLQAGQGYKARPLNGVWATAPFLHNGSVATIKDLVCKSQTQRPKYVLLGDIRFDDKALGLRQPKSIDNLAEDTIESGSLYTEDGYFILDSSISGNSNQGHSFSSKYDEDDKYNQKVKGVIGPAFTDKECEALLDYLKMI